MEVYTYILIYTYMFTNGAGNDFFALFFQAIAAVSTFARPLQLFLSTLYYCLLCLYILLFLCCWCALHMIFHVHVVLLMQELIELGEVKERNNTCG